MKESEDDDSGPDSNSEDETESSDGRLSLPVCVQYVLDRGNECMYVRMYVRVYIGTGVTKTMRMCVQYYWTCCCQEACFL